MAHVYGIKAEYLDLWGEDEDCIIPEDDLKDITAGWDKTPDDVIDQLYEIPVIFYGYDPDGCYCAIILDDGYLWQTDCALLTKYRRLNDEYYTRASDFQSLKTELEKEGWKLETA